MTPLPRQPPSRTEPAGEQAPSVDKPPCWTRTGARPPVPRPNTFNAAAPPGLEQDRGERTAAPARGRWRPRCQQQITRGPVVCPAPPGPDPGPWSSSVVAGTRAPARQPRPPVPWPPSGPGLGRPAPRVCACPPDRS